MRRIFKAKLFPLIESMRLHRSMLDLQGENNTEDVHRLLTLWDTYVSKNPALEKYLDPFLVIALPGAFVNAASVTASLATLPATVPINAIPAAQCIWNCPTEAHANMLASAIRATHADNNGGGGPAHTVLVVKYVGFKTW